MNTVKDFPKKNICGTLFISLTNGNMNGDPNAGGMPRDDLYTHIGIVTDVCLKRKLRNAIPIRAKQRCVKTGENKYEFLYVSNDKSLNAKEAEAIEQATGMTVEEYKKCVKKDPTLRERAVKQLQDTYFDARFFGGVYTTIGTGRKGAVQFGIGKTIDPIDIVNLKITRQAISKDKEMLEDGKETMLGDKYVVAYGLYRCDFTIDAEQAAVQEFTIEDLEALYDGIVHMFDHDRSASRADVHVRRAVVWERHDDDDDTADWKLLETLHVEAVPEVKEGKRHPRRYEDYIVTLDRDAIPATVSVRELV